MRFLILPAFLAAVLAVSPSKAPRQPFAVGEHAEYNVRYGIIHAGSAALSVVGVDTVRGHDAYHFRLTLAAGVNLLLYKYSARDTMQSWVDTATFRSLRFTQDQFDGGRVRKKRYEIFPDRKTFTDGDDAEQPSVENPLDDISFLFYVRTRDLPVGSSTEIPRHFKPASNPVVLRVLRKDTIEAAGKRWPTIVVQPVIKTSTMFANGEGQVWLSDDSSHVIVQINAKLSVGSITMTLRSFQPGSTTE